MPGYEEIVYMFDKTLPEIRFHLWSLYWLGRTREPKVMVELGVRAGDTTRALLAACKDSGAKLVSFDIAGDAYNVRQVTEQMGLPWTDGIWECHQGDSVEAGLHWDRGEVDLVMVDTDHSYDTTLREIEAWAPHVRPGGVMCFHDTGLNEVGRDGVRPAIERFVDTHAGWTFEDHPHVGEGDTGLGILWRHD